MNVGKPVGKMKSTESDVCYFEVDAVFHLEPVEMLEESMWTAGLRKTGNDTGQFTLDFANSVFSRRLGYCGCDEPTLSELYSEADDRTLYVQWRRDQPRTCTSPVSNGMRANVQSPPPAAWQQNSTHKNSIT